MAKGDRRYKFLQHKKKAFLAAFAETGNISAASKLSGICRNAHYLWLQLDPDYPAMFQAADQQAAEVLEAEARRRAVQGVDKPAYYKGEVCGTVKEYSDTLLIFLLKAAMPEKYQDRYSGTINNNLDNNVDDLTREEQDVRILDLLHKRDRKAAVEANCKVIDSDVSDTLVK